MLAMIAAGHLVPKFGQAAFLVAGLTTSAIGLEMMAQITPERGPVWLATASAIQGIGVGLIFTPLSTLAFSSSLTNSHRCRRVYNLMRQLGSAAGVAVMTVVLEERISAHASTMAEDASSGAELLHAAMPAAYADCFHAMAIATL